jgi:hypothetical protein
VPENDKEAMEHGAPRRNALPRNAHLAIPLVTILILLVFGATILLPANKSALPVQSTTFFIPIYVVVVAGVILGSLYLFKSFVEEGHPFSETPEE